jgi:hypothetical protein
VAAVPSEPSMDSTPQYSNKVKKKKKKKVTTRRTKIERVV